VFATLPTHTFEFGQPTSARLASTGIDQDGWFTREATIQLPPFDTDHDIILTLEFPGWSETKETALRVRWPDGVAPHAFTLTPTVSLPVRARLGRSAVPRVLQLSAAGDFAMPPPDSRRRSGRIVRMELQPVPRP
jgi:hypothetical protein